MTDPPRLLLSPEATDLERSLLGSWSDEKPPAGARNRTLAALGLGAATTAALGSMAPKAASSGWALVAKWFSLTALVVGGAAVGTAMLAHGEAKPAAAIAIAAPPLAQKVESPAATATALAPIELPVAPPVHASRARVAPASSTIAEQVAALDRARSALDSGDPARAVRLVDAYESEYPGGAFVQEAEVVRIESFVRQGKTAESERAAKRFLAIYPKSPHDARVRTLLGNSVAPAPGPSDSR